MCPTGLEEQPRVHTEKVLAFRETVPFSGYLSIISEVKEGESKKKMGIQVIFEGYPGLWDGVEKERGKENTHPRT